MEYETNQDSMVWVLNFAKLWRWGTRKQVKGWIWRIAIDPKKFSYRDHL